MSAATQVVHPVLASSPAALVLAEARLTDRQRLAALLEGAALLSLLERAAWWLPRGWVPARLSAAGRLLVPPPAAAPGRSPRPPQEQLRDLLIRLFDGAAEEVAAMPAGPAAGAALRVPGSGGPAGEMAGSTELAAWWSAGSGAGGAAPGSGLLAGRGEARRAGRALLAEWWQPLVAVPADEAVAQILAAASFLWQPAFAAARQSLAGELRGPAGDRLWVAGPSACRERLLLGCSGAAELAARLGGAQARAWWDGVAASEDGGEAAATSHLHPESGGAAPAAMTMDGAAGASHPGGGAAPAAMTMDGTAAPGADEVAETPALMIGRRSAAPNAADAWDTGDRGDRNDRGDRDEGNDGDDGDDGFAVFGANAAAGVSMPTVWRAVVAGARRESPASEGARLHVADAYAGLGHFTAALAILAPCRSVAARLPRARCQAQLGRLGAARATLYRLADLALGPELAIEVAELAVRVFANSGEPERVPEWVRRALAAGQEMAGAGRARAALVAAAAAWDRQDPAAMGPHLEEARAALFDEPGREADGGPGPGQGSPADEPRRRVGDEPGRGPDRASEAFVQALWRWHHARGMQATAAFDGAAVVAQLRQALRCARRRLARHEAAGLWNDLGIGRVQVGDLAGAERAFLHAQRLLAGCDGPRRATLALHNLAEVRLRRGRTLGVREILARSTAENRRAGNLRGLIQDTELWARFELVLGRPAAAAALCRAAMARLDRRRSPWRREVLAVLHARALGWLDQPRAAAAELAPAGAAAVAELEEEERPALWAQAGDLAAARQAAASLGPALRRLWLAVLDGGPVTGDTWEALAALEPYRAARLLFDLERSGGRSLCAPPAWRRPAIAALRQAGAGGFAAWLELREVGPWQALAAYAARPAGDLEAIAALLRSVSSDPDARLTWLPTGEVHQAPAAPSEPALVADLPAVSGEPALVADLPAGRLELRSRHHGPALAACFALAVRDLAAADARPAPAAAPEDGAGAPPGPARPAIPAAGTDLTGSSPGIRAAVARLALLAAMDIPVLIRGESGTGKELAARAIHQASARAQGPFIAVNCAAVAESLLLADLFGHVRGAFTGADRDRMGVFETARRGTVLLDEIGDLPLHAQGLLLRVLQEAEVRRLGESLPRRVDVRVLAATHRDLEQAVAAGTFRADLYYRLKVGAIDLPPLRDRGDDVLELAQRFLSRFSFMPPPRLTAAARERLRAHSWPGNVRELENTLRLAVALAGGGVIRPEHLELTPPLDHPAGEVEAAGAAAEAATAASAPPAAGSYHLQVEAFRRRLVIDAITAAGGNLAAAARRLGLTRQALSYLVRQLGLR